jgi:hypothetical protein
MQLQYNQLQLMPKQGFESLEDFFSTYTYDDSDGMLKKTIADGVLLGAGVGDMTIEVEVNKGS